MGFAKWVVYLAIVNIILSVAEIIFSVLIIVILLSKNIEQGEEYDD